MTLLQTLHLMVTLIAPHARATYQADLVMIEIAHVVGESKSTVFANKEQDAAMMLIQAWEESRFKANAVGDHGQALCAYQLHNAPKRVLTSMWLCTTLAYQRLRLSVKACPDSPLAPYIGGCGNRTARARSEYRLKEAVRLLEAVQKIEVS